MGVNGQNGLAGEETCAQSCLGLVHPLSCPLYAGGTRESERPVQAAPSPEVKELCRKNTSLLYVFVPAPEFFVF